MQKIGLTLLHIQKLDKEIEDLLKDKLPIHVKFKLHTLQKKLHSSVEIATKIEKELFEKYGYKDNGSYKIKMDSENYTIFSKEMEELMKEVVEIDYEPFNLSLIENVETNAALNIFFKLVNQEN